jgi:phenylacetic acid degradation operon negative regulatory protein
MPKPSNLGFAYCCTSAMLRGAAVTMRERSLRNSPGTVSFEHAFKTTLARVERPLRAWSLIVTIFGDVAQPRGGSLWLGTVNEIMGAFGIGEGVVRTAMSRLAADGWVERSRVGRNSYYRLTAGATAESERAAVRIYRLPRQGWSGVWSLAILNDGASDPVGDRRAALRNAGFAQLNVNLFIAPGEHLPASPLASGHTIKLQARSSTIEQDRRIAVQAWKLDRLADAYRAFGDHFAPLCQALNSETDACELTALAARLLVVHELRRIVLRDPGLPLELLGNDWQGLAARTLAQTLWLACLRPSERWLDSHARTLDGPLPRPSLNLSRRFKV